MKFMEISASSEFRPSLPSEVAPSLTSTPPPPKNKATSRFNQPSQHQITKSKNRYTPRRSTAGTWKTMVVWSRWISGASVHTPEACHASTSLSTQDAGSASKWVTRWPVKGVHRAPKNGRNIQVFPVGKGRNIQVKDFPPKKLTRLLFKSTNSSGAGRW